LAAVAMSGNIAHMLAPSENMAKYIRFIAALTLIIVIAAPIIRFDGEIKLPDLKYGEQHDYYRAFVGIDEQIKQLFEKSIKYKIQTELKNELKVVPNDIVIDVVGSSENLSVDSVFVYLNKSDAAKAQSVVYFLNNVLKLKSDVKVLK